MPTKIKMMRISQAIDSIRSSKAVDRETKTKKIEAPILMIINLQGTQKIHK